MTSNQHSSVMSRPAIVGETDNRRLWTNPNSYLACTVGPVTIDARSEIALGKLVTIAALGMASWVWIIGAFAVAV